MDEKEDRDVASQPLASKPTALEWSLAATLVDETYKLYLGRGAKPNEVEVVLETIRTGLAPAAFVADVEDSEEARLHAAAAEAQRLRAAGEPRDQDFTAFVSGLYQGFLGRPARSDELEFWAAASEVSLVGIAREIRDSEEARLYAASGSAAGRRASDEPRDQDFMAVVGVLYQALLGRSARAEELEFWAASDVSLVGIAREIRDSEEARLYAAAGSAGSRGAPDEPRDQDFMTLVAGLYRGFLGRAARPEELEFWAAASSVSLIRIACEIRDSEEARLHAAGAQPEVTPPADEPRGEDLLTLVAGLYRGFLGRSAKRAELEFWAAASGVPFVRIAREIRDSEEARRRFRRTTEL